MIFVDANVFMYAAGRDHALKRDARAFLLEADPAQLVTSAEVLQELLHAYLRVNRLPTLDKASELAHARTAEIWPLEAEDVQLARTLAARHPGLTARDLVHLASCTRREVTLIKTYDRALSAAFRL